MRLRIHPCSLIAIGVGLFLGGIGWALATGVAVPDQDPTPAMGAHAAFHGRITDAMMVVGVTCVIVGLLWGLASLVKGWRASRPAT